MNYDEIKRLIDDMGDSKIDELSIEFPDGIKISMKKEKKTETELIEKLLNNLNLDINLPEKHSESGDISEKEECIKKCEEQYKLIKSPMVGTFYSKPSPNAQVYVKVGDKVKKGDILCVVEAMKLMNEIESEYDGEIVEICAKDEEMVDYGKVLFKIK